ncbi:UNVERIFIED_CONTAM: hypothetical protein K2H54_057431 [Gekko kuhli]
MFFATRKCIEMKPSRKEVTEKHAEHKKELKLLPVDYFYFPDMFWMRKQYIGWVKHGLLNPTVIPFYKF